MGDEMVHLMRPSKNRDRRNGHDAVVVDPDHAKESKTKL